jgi:hypothetical protein
MFRRSCSEVASCKTPPSLSDAMKLAVRLQPTELRMDSGRVASATLENVLPCSLRLVIARRDVGTGDCRCNVSWAIFQSGCKRAYQASLRDLF